MDDRRQLPLGMAQPLKQPLNPGERQIDHTRVQLFEPREDRAGAQVITSVARRPGAFAPAQTGPRRGRAA